MPRSSPCSSRASWKSSREDRWSQSVHIIRSARPEAGRLPLLRLFTPNSLLALHAGRSQDNLKELHQRVAALGARDEGGPSLLGVMLLCGRNYSILTDLDIDQGERTVCSSVYSTPASSSRPCGAPSHSAGLEYPKSLPRIRIEASTDLPTIPGLSLPCDGAGAVPVGRAVRGRSLRQPRQLRPPPPENSPGHEAIYALAMIRPGGMTDRWPAGRRAGAADDGRHPQAQRPTEGVAHPGA